MLKYIDDHHRNPNKDNKSSRWVALVLQFHNQNFETKGLLNVWTKVTAIKIKDMTLKDFFNFWTEVTTPKIKDMKLKDFFLKRID